MIIIKLLSGPYKGATRVIPKETSPEEFVRSLFGRDWKWEIDYSRATDEEIYFWARQDIAVRIIRAIAAGLPVKFMDQVFQAESKDPAPEVLQKIAGNAEDAIVNSGRVITLESDDEKGVVLSERGFEH